MKCGIEVHGYTKEQFKEEITENLSILEKQ